MSIYTRTGDTGMTSLFGGKRVLKCEELVDVYGSIDELNSWIGLVSVKCKVKGVKLFLEKIQSDLFKIGSTLAGWKGDLVDLARRVGEMEKQIDAWEKKLPELRNFILPGGSTDAARVHVARSVCRRVERQAVALFQGQTLREKGLTLLDADKKTIIKYLNRLSDLMFVWARTINKKNHSKEIIWKGI